VELLRPLRALQDRIAQGDAEARAGASVMLGKIGEALRQVAGGPGWRAADRRPARHAPGRRGARQIVHAAWVPPDARVPSVAAVWPAKVAPRLSRQTPCSDGTPAIDSPALSREAGLSTSFARLRHGGSQGRARRGDRQPAQAARAQGHHRPAPVRGGLAQRGRAGAGTRGGARHRAPGGHRLQGRDRR
jgi:hypothetical protein